MREARQAVAIVRREVRAAEERLQLRGEEYVQRPSPAAGHRLHRAHVQLVDVGPLLAVDLDRHVVRVEELGDRRILEGLALHHVAPVAGGVADREEDRPVELARALERFTPPWIPVDRVVSVLEQVRARLGRESVGHPRQCRTDDRQRPRREPWRGRRSLAALVAKELRSYCAAWSSVTLRLVGSVPLQGGTGSAPPDTATGIHDEPSSWSSRPTGPAGADWHQLLHSTPTV